MATKKTVSADGAREHSPETDRKRADNLRDFIAQLERATDHARMDKAKAMLRSDRFQLFSEVTDDHVIGVVRSLTDPSLFFACKIDKGGCYMCCTQNLHPCGGLRGKPCKHLIVLMVGLVQSGGVDATVLSGWVKKAAGKAPALDKNAMAAVLKSYEDAKA